MASVPTNEQPHEACCTCATLLSAVPGVSSSEKPLPENRQVECCGRIICGGCIENNPRFLSYCPYCQPSGRSSYPHRLKHRPRAREPDRTPVPTPARDPPPYSPTIDNSIPQLTDSSPPPPPYSPIPSPARSTSFHPAPKQDQKQDRPPSPTPDPDPDPINPSYTTHHLRHTHPHDTIASLSLRYGIPAPVLRQHNNLTSDHLLAARQTLLIPTAYCTRPDEKSTSLSPEPVEDQAERARKTTIRRWMVACKEADYDVAVVYLEEVGYDLDEGVRRYWEDERWVREHPAVDGPGAGGGRRGKRKKGVGVGVGGWGWGLGRK